MSIKTMVIGFDQYGELVLKPGQVGQLLLHPQHTFRGDFLYFETEGLIIQLVKVGNLDQAISGVPSSYYKERETEESMKGRPIRFDAAMVGMIICFELRNVSKETVTVRGCIEGPSVL